MLFGGTCPLLGAAHSDAVFDAYPAAGGVGQARERVKLAGAEADRRGQS